MFCDFFSTTSLPIPGKFLLQKYSDHEIRALTQDVYKSGVQLRNLTMQTLPPLLIMLFFKVYCWARYRNLVDCEEAVTQKRVELTALALGVSSAINIGKVVYLANVNPLSPLFYLNYPQLAYFCKTLLHLIVLESRRNSYILKLRRNAEEFDRQHEEICALIGRSLDGVYRFNETEIVWHSA